MADGRMALMVALGALLLAAAPAAGQSVERSLAVAVIDGDGAPVPGLGPADFVVREDGVRREVLRVRQDPAPLQIALLVDTSEAAGRAIGSFRKGVGAFIDAHPDEVDPTVRGVIAKAASRARSMRSGRFTASTSCASRCNRCGTTSMCW